MTNNASLLSRRRRTRLKLAGSSRPRLSVFRSNLHIWAQVIDDARGITLASASDQKLSGTKLAKAALVGELIAQKALAAKCREVVFDRGSYRYHGRVKALAEAARKAGLSF
ncbi:MAG: 50S ribosomal protein L18 [uncultured bacterium]|nr:MAG: 50S ribosomal protein L18 [uncultured bacterium]